jgi:hypothetical protein
LARTKLTDKQKQKIIADYINTQNKSETARMNNVDERTVRRILNNEDSNVMRKRAEEKKEENTRDILEYMDKIYDKQKRIIDLSLEALIDKLQKPDMFTNVKDIVTVYGVIFDKALKYKEMQKNNGNNNGVDKVTELLVRIEQEANK